MPPSALALPAFKFCPSSKKLGLEVGFNFRALWRVDECSTKVENLISEFGSCRIPLYSAAPVV